jgi:hypothetical protein
MDHERHRQAEARMRELLETEGLPAPDEVEYEARSVYLRWVEQKLVVAIDLDDPEGREAAA